MKNLTAIIVTFLRDEYFYLCLSSLREQYPDINIIVGDQNPSDGKKVFCEKYRAEYVELPYDCGLCVARNSLINMVQTEYVLIGDDDFMYNQDANVDKMLELIEENYYIDLIGGRIREGGIVRNYQGYITEGDRFFIYKALDLEKEYLNGVLRHTPADLTFNFFIARKDAVKNVLWDEKIKVAYEHSSFFIDFKRAGYKAYFTPDAIVVHKPEIQRKNTENSAKYFEFRTRKSDKKRFFEKYNLDYCIDMGGRKDTFSFQNIDEVDFLITHFERWECLEKLLFSIAKYYPSANIYIGDQSRKFNSGKYNSLFFRLCNAGLQKAPKAYELKYDCGLSFARNYLFKISPSKYKLILEDDFVFTADTNIAKIVDILESNGDIGIVGGKVLQEGYELPFEHFFKKEGRTLYHVKNENEFENGFKITGCIPNFFLMRQNLGVLWDKQIKIEGEHHDFFLRVAETDWKVAYMKNVSINHEKINSYEYKQMRRRTEFLKILFNKHNIDKIVYLSGHVMEIKGNDVINYTQTKASRGIFKSNQGNCLI